MGRPIRIAAAAAAAAAFPLASPLPAAAPEGRTNGPGRTATSEETTMTSRLLLGFRLAAHVAAGVPTGLSKPACAVIASWVIAA